MHWHTCSIRPLRALTHLAMSCRLFSILHHQPPTIAIVGSGPAAFYAAQHLLRHHDSLVIDMYEKMPVPFGLVRYGVAPDHEDVKNVVTTFNRVASSNRLNFLGNVSVGSDITLAELRKNYTAVLLAYGATRAKRLGLPGEASVANVLSARDFVGWYNGHPASVGLSVCLKGESAVVIGNGNVALDAARILLSGVDRLRKTDTPEPVLQSLSESKVRQVHLIGRRGLPQAAFTIKEFRDFTKMPELRLLLDDGDGHCASLTPEILATMPRPRRRLTELVLRQTDGVDRGDDERRRLLLRFLLTPVEFVADSSGRLATVRCCRSRFRDAPPLQFRPDAKVDAAVADSTVDVDCGLAVVSVGYENVPLDSTVPMDTRTGIVDNKEGRVVGLPGVYCAGWLKTGPVGVIVTTLADSVRTAETIVADLADASLKPQPGQSGLEATLPLLASRGVRRTTFRDWRRIDAGERLAGRRLGKPREKFTTAEQMLRAADSAELDSFVDEELD